MYTRITYTPNLRLSSQAEWPLEKSSTPIASPGLLWLESLGQHRYGRATLLSESTPSIHLQEANFLEILIKI
jgi:hypothetical protein